MPKLSIITVNLNNAEGLQKTIESVTLQTYTDYEYIVIDGGSTDGSKEIIEKYADKITYWVSEPDKGIYNGMNKGIKAATGEYCLFLNSGDYLINNNILEEVFYNFPDKDIVYGNLQTKNSILTYPETLTLKTFFFSSIGHPASFIKLNLFEKYGYYNEQNKIVSDWEFFILSLIIHKCSYQNVNKTISFFEGGGISSSVKFKDKQNEERVNILTTSFPLMYDDYIEFKKQTQELIHYKNSRIIQIIKKFQESKFYKKIRVIK